MIDTSESLLDRLKADNAHDGWREFYRRYWGAILRYANKLGLNAHQAEEVLQDTMVALMRILPEFVYNRNKGRFRNFLLTIVHRKSMAVLRRARRDQELHVEWEEPKVPDTVNPFGPNQNGEADALNAWREVLLAEALIELRDDPTLGDQTFAVFEAYVIGKKTAAEVAATFGLKENGVYQIKNRLMRRLETRIGRLMRDSGSDMSTL